MVLKPRGRVTILWCFDRLMLRNLDFDSMTASKAHSPRSIYVILQLSPEIAAALIAAPPARIIPAFLCRPDRTAENARKTLATLKAPHLVQDRA
jgi:hypothetical protein